MTSCVEDGNKKKNSQGPGSREIDASCLGAGRSSPIGASGVGSRAGVLLPRRQLRHHTSLRVMPQSAVLLVVYCTACCRTLTRVGAGA